MRRFIVLSSIVAIALAGGVSVLDAQGRGGANRDAVRGDRPAVANPGQRGGMANRVGPALRGDGPIGFGIRARNLDLTEEQRTEVETLTRAARDRSGPIADELRLATSNLHRAIFADTHDGASIAELNTQASALRQQLADIRLETATSVAALLTPEQREQVRVGPAGRGRGAPMRGGRR